MTSLLSKLTLCLLIGSFLIFFTSCQAKVEQEALDAAIENTRAKTINAITGACRTGIDEMKDFRTQIQPLKELSRADQENGVEKRLYVHVIYLYRCKDGTTWFDGGKIETVEKKKDSEWKAADFKY